MKQDVETERSCRQAIYGRFASDIAKKSRRLQRARDFFNILLHVKQNKSYVIKKRLAFGKFAQGAQQGFLGIRQGRVAHLF